MFVWCPVRRHDAGIDNDQILVVVAKEGFDLDQTTGFAPDKGNSRRTATLQQDATENVRAGNPLDWPSCYHPCQPSDGLAITNCK
jgi:hypothetical protein